MIFTCFVVRKANIICSAENFRYAGIIMSEAFAKFRTTALRLGLYCQVRFFFSFLKVPEHNKNLIVYQ